MKTFQNQAAQGDMLLRRIDSLPAGVTAEKDEHGLYVLAHSETGHHHAVKADASVQFYRADNDNMIAYLVVDNEADLVHMRGHDTHETIRIKKGIYEVRRQREYTLEGWRTVTD